MSKKKISRLGDGRGKWGGGLTSGELINERLVQSFDPIYRNSLYQQMRYAFGENWRKDQAAASATLDGHTFPDYPDILVRYQEIGRSRRILNSQFIGLSRVMYSDPEPEFPQVDKYTAEVRKQFFLSRYRGDGMQDGEWAEDMAAAYMDGDGLGVGFVQVCLRTNPKTGEQQVSLRHSPAIFTLWDRYERSPGRARWICFVRYLPIDDAALIFGEETALANVRTVYDGHTTYGVKVVRYFEYYDMGSGNARPTRAIILNELSNPPWSIEENVFECLPFAYYTHLYVPMMRRPVGRIAMQMNTQEAINEIERALRKALRSPQFSIADVSQLDEEDLKAVNAGDSARIVRWKAKPGHTQDPFVRVPGSDVSPSVLKLLEVMDQQFTADSGVTDFDRGVQPGASRTLGEDMLVDQRGQTQSSWSELQAMRFHVRCVKKVLAIAALFDRDPVTLDIFGRNYTVNRPDAPASTMNHWLGDPSEVIINTDSLRYQDVQQVRLQRLQQLLEVGPFVGRALSLPWYAEELAKALGEQDPKQAVDPSALQGAAPVAGQPSQPVAPAGVPVQPGVAPPGMAPGMGVPPPVSQPQFRTPPGVGGLPG